MVCEQHVKFNFGHHTKSDNFHFEFGKGYIYTKHFLHYPVVLIRPLNGLARIPVTCQICNQTVNIKLSSVNRAKLWNRFYRVVSIFLFLSTIALIFYVPKIWFLGLIFGGTSTLVYALKDYSEPKIAKDFFPNYVGHRIL